MIAWLFEGFFHIIVGLVLLVGALGGAVFVLGRAIASGQFTDHDARTCQCPACYNRRGRAIEADKLRRGTGKKPGEIGSMVSTEQLRTGDNVEAKGYHYNVAALEAEPGGVRVKLRNRATGKPSFVVVATHRMQVKLWKVEA